MNTIVKICGIRTVDAANAAAQAGADLAGFNFVPTSSRYINPLYARRVIDSVRGKIGIVGVFRNAPLNEVNELVTYLGLEYVQLHGSEDPLYSKQISAKVIKAIPLQHDFDIGYAIEHLSRYNGEYLMVDRIEQGRGAPLMTDRLQALNLKVPVIIAGGLTHESVKGLVTSIRPAGVDVAGGIETNGQADPYKIKLFVCAAKGL